MAALPPRRSASAVAFDHGVLHGAASGLAPGATVALVLDGRVVASSGLDADSRFSLPIPGYAVSGALDVLDLADGRSLLRAPLDLAASREFTWLGWSCAAGRISGAFGLLATNAQSTPVLVQSFLDGELFFQALAQPAADGSFRFEGEPRRLLPMGRSVTIWPRVCGMDLNEPLTVSADSIGLLGHLDPTSEPIGRGWAVDLTDRTRRRDIDIRLNGVSAVMAPATSLREDIKALELSDGHSGFSIGFPRSLDRRHATTVQAFIAGTEIELVGSPYTLDPTPPVVGYFDVVEGPFAGGWAVNMHDPETPLEVEAVCDGELIGQGTADLYRGDVENAGMPTPWCGFRFLLDRPLVSLFDRDIQLRVTGTDIVLGGSPRQISQNNNIVRFLTRDLMMPQGAKQRLSRMMTQRTQSLRISIVMPVYNTKREWLIEALTSVMGQWSANWELVCVDDGSTEPHVAEVLQMAASHDPRIRYVRTPGNVGIARATNFGLRAASGDYVAFMDHDDIIEPDAIYKLGRAAIETGAEFIYSDEAITTDDINSVIEVRARPAFSHDYYISHPYFVHMICIRTALVHKLSGWDETLPISADVDFVLRAVENAEAVAHVPSVLYRWRTHGGSAGHTKQALVTATMKQVISDHLTRQGRVATVREGLRYNEYRIDWPDDGGEILIVIPTKNRVDLLKACIDSIEKTSPGENYRIVVIDHESTDKKTVNYLNKISGKYIVMPYSGVFNYALMNNLAVKTHGAGSKYVLFLNNDVEAFEQGWLARLRSLAARPEVGAVGPLLLYGDNRIQHAGVLMAFAGAADHAMKFQDAYLGKNQRHPGYNCNLTSVRDYSAVTAACVMIRMEVFRAVEGFDESFVVGFNDTDLCLRIVDTGYKVLYDGATVLYHHESATRTESKSVEHPEDDARLRKRWAKIFSTGDPFYSPLLAPRGTDHTLRQDQGCTGMMSARVVGTRPKIKPTARKTEGARRRKPSPVSA